jgi:hypothetical protein
MFGDTAADDDTAAGEDDNDEDDINVCWGEERRARDAIGGVDIGGSERIAEEVAVMLSWFMGMMCERFGEEEEEEGLLDARVAVNVSGGGKGRGFG